MFAHHTFQEYYSALFLAKDTPEQNRLYLLESTRLLADWWSEVVLLYVGALPDATEFLRSLGDYDADDLCQLRLRLAAWCLGERPIIKEHMVRDALVDRILYVRSSRRRTDLAARFMEPIIDYLKSWSRGRYWHEFAAVRNVTAKQDHGNEQFLVPKVLEALDDHRNVFRTAGLLAVYAYDDKAEYQALWLKAMDLFADPDSAVRCLAIRVVARFKAASAVPLLVDRIRYPDADFARESINALLTLASRLDAPAEAAQCLSRVTSDGSRRSHFSL
jgi:GNAT superfamily N-acetyltransferase